FTDRAEYLWTVEHRTAPSHGGILDARDTPGRFPPLAVRGVPVSRRSRVWGARQRRGRWGLRSERRSDLMARIIVTTEQTERPDPPVLLDERVCPEHLSDDPSAAQLIQRLGWAISDAERVENGQFRGGGSS